MSASDFHPNEVAQVCPHPDVRYFEDEKGAIACMVCGRLFGHLVDERIIPHNPPAA